MANKKNPRRKGARHSENTTLLDGVAHQAQGRKEWKKLVNRTERRTGDATSKYSPFRQMDNPRRHKLDTKE